MNFILLSVSFVASLGFIFILLHSLNQMRTHYIELLNAKERIIQHLNEKKIIKPEELSFSGVFHKDISEEEAVKQLLLKHVKKISRSSSVTSRKHSDGESNVVTINILK